MMQPMPASFGHQLNHWDFLLAPPEGASSNRTVGGCLLLDNLTILE